MNQMYNPHMAAFNPGMANQQNPQQMKMQGLPQMQQMQGQPQNQPGPMKGGQMMQQMPQGMGGPFVQYPQGMMMPMMMVPGPNGTFSAQPFPGMQPNPDADRNEKKNLSKRKFKETREPREPSEEIPTYQKPLLPSGEPDPRVETYNQKLMEGKSALAALNEFCAKGKCGSPDFKEDMNKSTKTFKVTVHLAGMDWGWGESKAKGVAKHLAANETLKMLIQTYDGTTCIIPGIDKVEKKDDEEYDGSADVIEDVEGGPDKFNFGPVCNWAKWSMYLNMYCQFKKFKNPVYHSTTTVDPETKKASSQCTGSFEYIDEDGEEQVVEGSEVALGKREAQHKLAAKFLAIALPNCTGHKDAFDLIDEMKIERRKAKAAVAKEKRDEIRAQKRQKLKEEAAAEEDADEDEDIAPGDAKEEEEEQQEEEAAAPEVVDYTKMTVQELKAKLKEKNLSVIGARSTLLKRLQEAS